MPIRFQVDPDFYDHPKTLGMSDAATALWVRAGSYSAAKLTDGFVADAALALLSQLPMEAARELIRRGLWSRVKGGYRFHQWGERNLSRERVDADRHSDRERKRRERESARQNGKPQVEGHSVPPDVRGDSGGIPPGVRAVSVSVSTSVSGSESGPPPPSTCPEHPNGTTGGCRACGDARRWREAWDQSHAAEQRRNAARERSSLAWERAETRRPAIAACGLCDDRGYQAGVVCDHDRIATDRAHRGATLARQALAVPDPGATP